MYKIVYTQTSPSNPRSTAHWRETLTSVQFVTNCLQKKAVFRNTADCTLERNLTAVHCVTNRLHKNITFKPTFILERNISAVHFVINCFHEKTIFRTMRDCTLQRNHTDPRSRIPDPKTEMKDRGEKNFLSYLFFEP